MTLRMRMAGATAGLIFSLLLMIALALWAVTRLSQQHAKTFEEYEELRLIEQVGLQMARTRGLLDSTQPDADVIRASITHTLNSLERYITLQEQSVSSSREHQKRERASIEQIVAALRQLIVQLSGRTNLRHAADRIVMVTATEDLLQSLAVLETQTSKGATESHQRADTLTRRAVIGLSMTGMLIAIAGIALCIAQYHSVIRPLRHLRRSARRIASGELSQRVDESGDREFAELAGDFNTMTAELQSLYRDLNQRVETKSRQLVRSERLASVGYLAAGVAHEINNPLSIIAGHAEMTLNRLRKLPADNCDPELAESLQIVMEEAFRCKQITNKLLSLTRQEQRVPQPVDLYRVAKEVQAMVAGLKQFRGRVVDLHFTDDAPLIVLAREPEMKQVLLNLTVNSLEATNARGGRVTVAGRADNGHIVLSVIDNGRGMSPEDIDLVFEPFYTHKRGTGERGTGLGLSIVHAIIEEHGGHIDAFSDGIGKGGRFTIKLPACTPKESDDTSSDQS